MAKQKQNKTEKQCLIILMGIHLKHEKYQK